MMKKFPLFYFADLKKSPTFAVHKELGSHICWSKGEKGIRCESGTIPVAVYLDSIDGVMFVAFFATGKILGRRNKRDESEDLPVHLDDWYLQDTGVNQNCF